MNKKKKKINTRNTPIRERILETASRLFYENGIQAVGVDKIVAEAKVAKMTLYSYFASKDDLIIEYLEKSSIAWFEEFHAYLNSKCKSDSDRLLQSFIYIKESFGKSNIYRGSGFVNAATEISDPKDPAHSIILEHQENLRECFERWAFNSGFRNVRELSYLLINRFSGTIVSTMVEDFPEPITHTLNTIEIILGLYKG